MTAVAIGCIAVAAWLWVRQYRTPPDTDTHRRLMRELRRFECELYEHQP